MKIKVFALALCAALLMTSVTAYAGSFDLPEINPDTHEVVNPNPFGDNDNQDEGFETDKAKFEEIKTPVDASALNIQLQKTAFTFNNKVVTPKVIVKEKSGRAVPSSNYTVKYPNGRKNIGYYTVYITFTGDYTGSAKRTFSIVPKGTKLAKVTRGKKNFTAKWNKQTNKTNGYQLQYSTDKKFKKSCKSVLVKKNKMTSRKVTGLKGNKKYYVRVRTYTRAGKNYLYSAWSNTKQIKTKK